MTHTDRLTIEDIREEAKIDLHNCPACERLPPVTNPSPAAPDEPTGYARAIFWCESWIDRQDIDPGADPRRLADDATVAWRRENPRG
jgi:hypothetical protein